MNFDYFIFGLLGVVWGSNFLSMKLALQVLTPLQVAWMRVLCGAIPIVAFSLYRRSLKFSDFKNTHHFLVMAVLSTAIPFIGFVKGTEYLKSGAAGAISGSIPLMVALFALIFLPNEKLNLRKTVGLILGLIGVALVAQVSKLLDQTSNDALYGTLFMLLGCAGYAAGMVYTRKFITPLAISPLVLSSYQTAFAAILLMLIVPMNGVSAILYNPKEFAAVAIGLGFLGTGCAFIMYYHIIEKLGAVTASSVFYIPPVTALIIGAVLAKEWISLSQCVGTAVILMGVYLARGGGETKLQPSE